MSSQANCVACDESPGTISMKSSVLVSKMYQEITGLNVKSHYTICKSCHQELRSCYNFRKRCVEIFSLYNSASSTAAEKSSKSLASPIEFPFVKTENEQSNSTVTFQDNKEDDSVHDYDFPIEHPDDDDYAGINEDDFETGQQYEDLLPPMSDDDDLTSNENDPDYDETSARFQCDECSKKFSKRSRLVAHKAEHRNERLFTCPRPGCNSAFNVPHRLTRHLRNVHDADEEEINESTFALVEDSVGVYVVRNSWLFSKEGVPHIFYPSSSTKLPDNFVKFFNKPSDEWEQYQVKILRQKIPSYELTKRLQEIRMQKRNLNIDAEPQAKKVKMSGSSGLSNFSQIQQHNTFMPSFPFNRHLHSNQQKSNSVQGSFLSQSQINIPSYQHEKMKLMEFNFNTQLRDLKKKLNYLMHMVQGKGSTNASIQNTLEDDQYSPKAISSEQELTEMERNLIQHDRNPMISSDFSIKRERMIDHYAAKLKNINKRTNPKNGLIGSLLNLYFAPEFLNQIGWTNAQGRLAIKDMVGHISLFFEIVNRNTPSTYVNMEEASNALYTFLRRFHEAKNAKHRVKDKDIDMCKIICDENSKHDEQMYRNTPLDFFPKVERNFDTSHDSMGTIDYRPSGTHEQSIDNGNH